MPLEMARLEFDLLAGTASRAEVMTDRRQRVLVFDSGLGGLTVLTELAAALPAASFIYAADDAGFPYGRLSEAQLVERVVAVMERLLNLHQPGLVVIACNTASTIVLPALRARFSIPFVGTVPAIKPAAEKTVSKLVSVIATQGTIQRDYTRALVETYAGSVEVTLVAASRLASLAEAHLRGETAFDHEIAAEIAPCFVERNERRTDVIVLACTHYPLLLPRLQAMAPWPVTWIDPAPAIARRAASLLSLDIKQSETEPPHGPALAVFTSGRGVTLPLREALAAYGLAVMQTEAMPLMPH